MNRPSYIDQISDFLNAIWLGISSAPLFLKLFTVIALICGFVFTIIPFNPTTKFEINVRRCQAP